METTPFKQLSIRRTTDVKLGQAIKKVIDELHVNISSRDMIIDFLVSRYLAEEN